MKFGGFEDPLPPPLLTTRNRIVGGNSQVREEIKVSNVCPYHVGRQVEENSIIEASSPAHTSYLYLVPGVPSF